jgi:hypothetical protein
MNATTIDNCPQRKQKEKHIMISYNHATASTVSRKICDRLRVNIQPMCEKIFVLKMCFDLHE